MRALFAAALALAPVAAQDKPSAQSFFPSEYRAEFRIDFARLRQLEVWDGLRGAVLAPLLGMFEQVYGFDFDDLEQIRGSMTLPEAARTSPKVVFVMSGNDSVRVPEFGGLEGSLIDTIEIADHTVKRERPAWNPEDPGTLYYSPQNGVLVQAHDALLRPVLEGRHKGGVPAPELMRHTADGDHLAFWASHLNAAMRSDLPPGIEDWLVEGDPVTFLMLGLRTTGVDDDEEIMVEGLLQCERGTDGPPLLEKKIREGLEALQSHRQLGALKRYWKQVEVLRDGRDVRVRLALGPPRRAAGALTQLLTPLMLLGTLRAVPEPAVIVAPVEDAKAEKKKRDQ